MKIMNSVKRRIETQRKNALLKTNIKCDLFGFGDDYDGYFININSLNSSSVVYSFGIGEDLVFSETIISELNCNVYAFDPTPKSINYVQNHKLYSDKRFNFYPVGLADYDGVAQFHLPTNDEYVSGSMEKWSGVKEETIEVNVKKLGTIMSDMGHTKIDLLKMDIEGTEFDIIDDIIKNGIDVKQICVEIHERFFDNGIKILSKMIKKMKKAGFRLISRNADNLTFVKLK